MIEDRIGKGGMGAVYRAVDQKFGSVVAIKETFYGDTVLAEAFEREARLLNTLHHPILPHVSDSFTENGGHFLVMEYIEGEDLSEMLRRGETFSVESVIQWTMELLDGLDYLHSQDPPIIHRDIKPNNLKVTSRGKIVLLDFGMAKETESNTLAAKSVFGYSRRYSPLEQIEGSGTDARSDIFSLGATLYHLLTGKAPVDVLARASAIVAGRPDPLVSANELNPDVPADLASLLSSALALNAENRFESARAMAAALEQSAGERSRARDVIAVPIVDPGEPAPFDPLDSDMSEDSDQEQAAQPSFAAAAAGASSGRGAFNARSEFKRRMGNSFSGSLIGRLGYAVWLPAILLGLALVLWGAYRGLSGGETANVDSANQVAETTASDSPTPAEEAPIPATSVAESETSSGPDAGETAEVDRARTLESEADTRNSDSRRGDAAITESEEAEEAEEGEKAQPRKSADESPQPRRSTTQRQRRVEEEFEQPEVSSIEAIMSGTPRDRRPRWIEEDELIREERRRRRLRRMMRENRRYQEPF